MSLSYVSPPPITTHEVESPNGFFSGDTSSSSSFNLDNFQNLVNECEAGDWTLYLNRNHPTEQQYTFTVTFTSLSSSNLPPVTILSPTNGATGIATNHAFLWSGPTGWNSLYCILDAIPSRQGACGPMPHQPDHGSVGGPDELHG